MSSRKILFQIAENRAYAHAVKAYDSADHDKNFIGG